ncbi:MAG TPA: 2-hydroxychromene-2-carboxylate isomerase [Roseiarcus sp.]|nr:2-hydroxychromene-2-carboxylate isomerase [Roseiarcus sp.]
MAPTIDFWFDFASTYSYPAAMRAGALAEAAGVALNWRPFLLGPIFVAQGWRDSPFNLYPRKGRYMWRDLERICVREGLPLKRPDAFPQNSLLAARCTLALGAADRPAFVRAVFAAEFAEGGRIDQPATLAALLAEKGLPQSALGEASSDRIKQALRAETEEAQRRDLFGAPSFLTQDGELFWGNDRLEEAIAWAAAH